MGYNLNSPLERARLLEDARKYYGSSEIWVHYPAGVEYRFHNITEAIMAVLQHAMEVDAIGDEKFVSCGMYNIGSIDICIHIIATSGDYKCSYNLKKVESYDYKYRPQKVNVMAHQEVKVEEQKPVVAKKTDETKEEEPTTTAMTPLKGVYKMNLSPEDLFGNDKDEKTAISIREFVNRIAPGAGYRAERLDEKSVQITIY